MSDETKSKSEFRAIASLAAEIERLRAEVERLRANLSAIARLAVDAVDATDPVIYEKDWFSDDPSDSYRTLHVLLEKIHTLASTAGESASNEEG